MKKAGKMMLLGIVLASGMSSITYSWWGGWRRRPVRVLHDWRIKNNSNSALRISNDVGRTIILEPGTDALLPRPGSYGIFVQDLTTGQQKSFSTAGEVVIIYHDYWNVLSIATQNFWDAAVGWSFGPFAIGLGGWWGRGWGPRWRRRYYRRPHYLKRPHRGRRYKVRHHGGWWHGRAHRGRGARVGRSRGGRAVHYRGRGGRTMGSRRGGMRGRGGGRRR